MANPEGPPAPSITKGAQDPSPPQDPPAPSAPQAPHVPQPPQVPQQLILHMPSLHWSHFKLSFSGKPDEDAEEHLLRTNNWMDTHRLQDNNKVQRFCLTLTGEARLWYESLRPINADWVGL